MPLGTVIGLIVLSFGSKGTSSTCRAQVTRAQVLAQHVEIWFGIIERQGIHRGTFAWVRKLMIKSRILLNGWNDRRQPFIWTQTHDQILKKADRKATSVDCNGHWRSTSYQSASSGILRFDDCVLGYLARSSQLERRGCDVFYRASHTASL